MAMSNEKIVETVKNSISDAIKLYNYEFKEIHNEKYLRKYAEKCAEVYFKDIVGKLYKGNIGLEEANDNHSILVFRFVFSEKRYDIVVVAAHYTYDYQYGYGYEHVHSKIIETTRNIKAVSLDINVEKKEDGYAE